MNTFPALYRKELAFLAKPLGVLVVIHIAGIVALLVTGIPEYGNAWSFKVYVEIVREHFAFLDFFMYGSILLIPFLLGYSWYEDWNDRTSLQLLSLPARRSTVAWSKYWAAMTLGACLTFGIFVYHYLYDLKISPHIGLFPRPFSAHVMFAVFMFCAVTLITALLSVSTGVMTSVRKHRLAAGIAAFVTLGAVSWGVLHLAVSGGQSGLPEMAVSPVSVTVKRGVVLIIESVMILTIGHVLFERYVEV